MSIKDWEFVSFVIDANAEVVGGANSESDTFFTSKNSDSEPPYIDVILSSHVSNEELTNLFTQYLNDDSISLRIFFEVSARDVLISVIELLYSKSVELDEQSDVNISPEKLDTWKDSISQKTSPLVNPDQIKSLFYCQLIEATDAQWQQISAFQLVANNLSAISVHPTDSLFACGTSDGRILFIIFRDDNEFDVIREFDAHETRVTAITWNHNGNSLASGDSDGNLRIWNVVNSFRLITQWKFSGSVWSVDWSAHNLIAVATNNIGSIRILDPVRGETLYSDTLSSRTPEVLWTPDNKLIFNPNDSEISILDHNLALENNVVVPNRGEIASFSVNSQGHLVCASREGTIYVKTSRQWHDYGVSKTPILDLACEPNGARIIVVTIDGVVSTIKWSNSRFSTHKQITRQRIRFVTWIPEGKLLLVENYANQLSLQMWLNA